MKALKLFAFGIIMFAIQGCYTVIWTPDVALPTKERSENSDSFYEEIYYGEYSPYYELPWWYSVTPPAKFVIPASERTAQETKLRKESTTDRIPENRMPIYIKNPVEPPTQNQPPTTNPPTTNPPTTGTDNSSTKTESTTKQRDNGNSSNSRDTRNNDGSRSSDTPRR